MPPPETKDFNRYFTPDEVATICRSLEERFPDFVRVHRIGRTHQGRDILLLEISDSREQSPGERPGYYIDAATHADEVVGTSVALYVAARLAEGAAAGEQQSLRALQRVVFYILPVVNPDGADVVLNSRLPWVGNGRYLPGEEQPGPGFYYADVDGNGFVGQMRVADPLGEWKVSDLDERLLTLRDPDEDGEGPYYRLLPEGLFRDWDGATMRFEHKPLDGNLNRNYPKNWTPERLQYGAGDYPTSEPEIRAVVDFVLAHPNIAGITSFHTHAGAILRPFASKPDSMMPAADLRLYETIGALGTAETGYPVISTYGDFTPTTLTPRGGMLTDWSYEELGILSFTMELWNPFTAAGIEDVPLYHIDIPLSGEAALQMLRWAEAHVENAFMPWTTFEHPQLGEVEIGGWNRVFVFRNPPPQQVEAMATDQLRFVLRHAATLPRVVVERVEVQEQGGGVYSVTAHVANAGYQPTPISEIAVDTGAAATVRVSLEGEAIQVLDGQTERDLGHLAGRADRETVWNPWGTPWGIPRKAVRWLVRGPTGSRFTIRAGCPRGGYDSQEAVLQ